jgi:hypothetical protein
MLPGPLLTAETEKADIKPRLASKWAEEAGMAFKHDEAARVLGSMWSRVGYIPEHLLLMVGPTIHSDRNLERGLVAILVLKLAPRSDNTYEGVGIGALRGWDEKAATIQTLKII